MRYAFHFFTFGCHCQNGFEKSLKFCSKSQYDPKLARNLPSTTLAGWSTLPHQSFLLSPHELTTDPHLPPTQTTDTNAPFHITPPQSVICSTSRPCFPPPLSVPFGASALNPHPLHRLRARAGVLSKAVLVPQRRYVYRHTT